MMKGLLESKGVKVAESCVAEYELLEFIMTTGEMTLLTD